jgi:transglutaminase-like putative cysteine protease
MQRTRARTFAGWLEKANYLDGAAWDDARAPLVRDVARRVAVPVNPNRPDLLAEAIFNYCQRAIRYVKDPASEEFSDAEQVLRDGFGDCDDKCRVFVALARSVGLEARIRPVLAPDPEDPAAGPDFVHVQAECRYPGSYRHRRARLGGWLSCELILAACALGDEPQHVTGRELA